QPAEAAATDQPPAGDRRREVGGMSIETPHVIADERPEAVCRDRLPDRARLLRGRGGRAYPGRGWFREGGKTWGPPVLLGGRTAPVSVSLPGRDAGRRW